MGVGGEGTRGRGDGREHPLYHTEGWKMLEERLAIHSVTAWWISLKINERAAWNEVNSNVVILEKVKKQQMIEPLCLALKKHSTLLHNVCAE